MKTRAAVAFEAKKPLEIVELDLEGPKAGEVLVEIKATGVCHTDAYTLDGSIGRIFPVHPRPRRRRHRARSRRRRDVASSRATTSFRSTRRNAGKCKICLSRQDQSVHRDPRDAGQGADARRHVALLLQGQAHLSLHGLLDVLELHGAAGDRGREDSRGRAVRQELLHRLRRDHGHRRGAQHRQGRGRARTSSSSVSAASASTSSRALKHGRRATRSSASTSTTQGEWGAQVRHDAISSTRRRSAAISSQHLVELTGGGADYTLRLHRQHHGDAPGARGLPSRLGRERHHRRRGRRARKSRRGRSSWSPAACGTAPRSAGRAAAPTCRRSSTGTWTARSRSIR